jgi:hypothetical protein
MRIQEERERCGEAEVYFTRMAHNMNATLMADIARTESQFAAFSEWLEIMSQQNQIMVEEVSPLPTKSCMHTHKNLVRMCKPWPAIVRHEHVFFLTQLGYFGDAQQENERLRRDMHRLNTENAVLKSEVEQLEAKLEELVAEKHRIEREVSTTTSCLQTYRDRFVQI